VSCSGSGNGIGAGSAAKRQKFLNRHEQRDRADYGTKEVTEEAAAAVRMVPEAAAATSKVGQSYFVR
jgi:hypothetical protein